MEKEIEKDPLDDNRIRSKDQIIPAKTKTPEGVTTVVASSEESEEEEEKSSELEDGETSSSSEVDSSSSTDYDSEEERERRRKRKKKKKAKAAKARKAKQKKKKKVDEDSSGKSLKKITDDTYENLKEENRVVKNREKIKATIKEKKKNLEIKNSREQMSHERNEKRQKEAKIDDAMSSRELKKKEVDLRDRLSERSSQKAKQETVTSNEYDNQERYKEEQYTPKNRSPSPINRSRLNKGGYNPNPHPYYNQHNQYHGYGGFRRGGFFQRPNQRNSDNWNREGWRSNQNNYYNTRNPNNSRSRSPRRADKINNERINQRRSPHNSGENRFENRGQEDINMIPENNMSKCDYCGNMFSTHENLEMHWELSEPCGRWRNEKDKEERRRVAKITVSHPNVEVPKLSEKQAEYATQNKNAEPTCGWEYYCDKCNTNLTHQKLMHHHLCKLAHCQYGCGAMFAGENLKNNHERVCKMIPEGLELEEETVNSLMERCRNVDDWKNMIGAYTNKEAEDSEVPEKANIPKTSNQKSNKTDDSGIEIIFAKKVLVLGQLGYIQKGPEDTQVKYDSYDPTNKRFKKGEKELETELENQFRPLNSDERRAVVGLANLDKRRNLEIITHEEIKLAVTGLSRLVGNMHAGLYKRDPKDFRHNHVWIQIQLKREFDRICTEYSPERLTKAEDIGHTVNFVTKQIMDMFAKACKLLKKEIPRGELDSLKVKTGYMVKKAQKLYSALEVLSSNGQRGPTSSDTGAQLSETIHSETE